MNGPSSQMRVLVSGGLAEGGVRTHVFLLCATLRKQGIDVTLAATATNWPRGRIRELERMGVRVLTTPWGFGRWAPLAKLQALATWPFLLRGRFDVLYCVGYSRLHRVLTTRLAASGMAIYHEIVDAPAGNASVVAIVQRMNGIVANSELVARQWEPLAPGVPLRVIPFLTENVAPKPSRPGGPLGPDGVLRAVYLGRLVKHKRVDWLVRSWGSLSQELGPSRLDVYGGDYQGERLLSALRNDVATLGVENRVAIHGPYDGESELQGILDRADVLLLPSLYEGLPLVLVEAMAAGVPVVATAAGGTAELGRDNPDVEITDVDLAAFSRGLIRMAARLRSGAIQPARLARWTQERYGRAAVTKRWLSALCDRGFWQEGGACEPKAHRGDARDAG